MEIFAIDISVRTNVVNWPTRQQTDWHCRGERDKSQEQTKYQWFKLHLLVREVWNLKTRKTIQVDEPTTTTIFVIFFFHRFSGIILEHLSRKAGGVMAL